VFDGEGGKRGVGDQVAAHLVRADELAEDPLILGARLRQPGDRRREPVGDALPCCGGIERSFKRARVGRDAQERVDALPRETNPDSAVELLGHPGCGLLVLLGALVNGVEQTNWRRAASAARRTIEGLERVGDVVEVNSTAEIVGPLPKRSRWLVLCNEAGANKLVDGLAQADRALATNPLDGSGDVVGQGESGAYGSQPIAS